MVIGTGILEIRSNSMDTIQHTIQLHITKIPRIAQHTKAVFCTAAIQQCHNKHTTTASHVAYYGDSSSWTQVSHIIIRGFVVWRSYDDIWNFLPSRSGCGDRSSSWYPEHDDAEAWQAYGEATIKCPSQKNGVNGLSLELTKGALKKEYPWGTSISWKALEDLHSTVPN